MIKKIYTKKRVWIFILLVLLVSSLPAVQFLGDFSLVRLPAMAHLEFRPINPGQVPSNLVGQSGGILFSQTAQPAIGLTIENLRMHYSKEMPDGQRLNLEINGQAIVLPGALYDWLLIPIAKYANAPDFGVFTLFGHLEDSLLEEVIIDRGGEIMNYHTVFDNTLLGLRHYQMDILALYLDTTFLPTEEGNYILGEGETEPDVLSNQDGLFNFIQIVNSTQEELGQTHRSYTITDAFNDIVFNIDKSTLEISSDPYYFYWRFRNENPEYDRDIEIQRLILELDIGFEQSRDENPDLDFRDWLISKFISTLHSYEENHIPTVIFSGTIATAISLPTDEERHRFLSRFGADDLYNNLIGFSEALYGFSIDYLEDYSDRLSEPIDEIRAINPQVWDATVTTMRYAAFFRFCKHHFPEQWEQFIAEIQDVMISPKLETPTVMYISGDPIIEELLDGLSPEIPGNQNTFVINTQPSGKDLELRSNSNSISTYRSRHRAFDASDLTSYKETMQMNKFTVTADHKLIPTRYASRVYNQEGVTGRPREAGG